MNFDDTSKFAPKQLLPPPLRSYLIRRFGGLPSNWWDLLTPKGWKYVKAYAAGEAPHVSAPGYKPIKRVCMSGRGENLGKEKKCGREVCGRAEYCHRCIGKRRNILRRQAHAGLKTHTLANSPLQAEALMTAKIQVRYNHPEKGKPLTIQAQECEVSQ